MSVPPSLIYITDAEPGFTRRRAGKGFSYRDAEGHPITDKSTIQRIKSLGIPPAWESVWISPTDNGHIQATGRDAKGRKQYRYHTTWNEAQDTSKFAHMLHFAHILPKLRRKVRAHMNEPGLGRTKVLATVVNLLETTLIRIGNEDYARTNKSYGLSTLRNRHVTVQAETLRFQFTGKSGKSWNLKVADRRLAQVVKACQSLPGQKLFQYLDDTGERHAVTSQDINAYLREISGEDITAKDFRTWAGTVLAASHLARAEAATSATHAKRVISATIKTVAARLGNTPAICRKCYVHPQILTSYTEGRLAAEAPSIPGLKQSEAAVVGLLTAKPRKSRLQPSPVAQSASV